MATACESKGVKRPRLERLNERLEDPPFDVTLKAMMAGVRRRSVGKRAIELMSETLTETSGTLACLMSESDEESAFPIARTHLTWSNFAADWYVDVLRTRVAFISIGRRGQTGVGNLFISSLSLDPISVPLSLLMSQNNPDNQNVGEWIRCRIPALHQIIRNKLIFKVVTPADLVYSLIQEHEDLNKVGPFIDPVNAAARLHHEEFAKWIRSDRYMSLFKPDFGHKCAVRFYIGRQDSFYEADEEVEDENGTEQNMLEWLDDNKTDYSRRQRMWMVETDAFAKLAILETFNCNARRQEKLEPVTQFGSVISSVLARNWQKLNDVWGGNLRIPKWVLRQGTIQAGVKYIMDNLAEEAADARPAFSCSSSSSTATSSTASAASNVASNVAEWGSSSSSSTAAEGARAAAAATSKKSKNDKGAAAEWGACTSTAASNVAEWGSTTTTTPSSSSTAAEGEGAAAASSSSSTAAEGEGAAAASSSSSTAAEGEGAAAAAATYKNTNINKKGKIVRQYEMKDFQRPNGSVDCSLAIRTMCNLRDDQLKKLIAVRKKLQAEGRLDCRRHLNEYRICTDCGEPPHLRKKDCRYLLAFAGYRKNEKVSGLTLPCLRCDGSFDHVADVCGGVHAIDCPKCHR